MQQRRYGDQLAAQTATMAAQQPDAELLTVELDGLPQGNPPRSLAFKLKFSLRLQATPTLLLQQRGTAALVLPGSAGDAAALRRAAAQGLALTDGDVTRELPELGLGPHVRLVLRRAVAASVRADDPVEAAVDGRPWGRFVMQRTADSNLAPGPPSKPPPSPETWETVRGLAVSETAKRVLRGAGTDPKGLTCARGGFDDHAEEGTYLCAGCHSPLYSSEAKWDCGCGWPGFWTCKKDALYERRDGARGEIRCTTCDSHIGHVYRGEGYDNPPPNERHCANSSALVFQPAVGDLVRPGYSGAVYMTSFAEDNLTVYTDLSGPEPRLKLFSYVKGFGAHIASEVEPPGKTAVFAMGCYWHAEVVFGAVPGVMATEVGFVGKVEVVRVLFDHREVAYVDLIKRWRDNHDIGVHTSEFEQSAIYPTPEQRAEAELMLKLFRGRAGGCGLAEVRVLERPFRLAKESDQLYHLRKSAPGLLELGLGQEQLTRVNSCIGTGQDYVHLVPS